MDFSYEINNWAAGVVQSLEGDKLPPQALKSALNTMFVNTGGDQTDIGTRPGFPVTMVHGGTVTVAVKAAAPYTYFASDSAEGIDYTFILPSGGGGHYRSTADVEVASQSLSPTNGEVDWAVAKNRLFLTGVRAGEGTGGLRSSLLGTAQALWGTVPPVNTSLTAVAAPSGTPGLPVATYSVYATSRNPLTLQESNPTFMGEVTTTASLNSIAAVIDTSFNALNQGSAWHLYVQNQTTQAQHYRVTTVYNSSGAIISADGAIPWNTSTGYISLSAAELLDLIIPMPGLTENTVPPRDIQYLAAYGGRLVAASFRKIFWSKLDAPDAWPPENFEFIEIGEGNRITGLHVMEDEKLLVFTDSGLWAIDGNDPQSWTIKLVDSTIGCTSFRSIIAFDGALAWWSPQYGPVIMRGGQIEKIGLELLGRNEEYSALTAGDVIGGWDPYYQHIVWAVVVGPFYLTPSRMLPYNYRLNAWAADYWDPINYVDAMFTSKNSLGEERLYVCGRGSGIYMCDHRSKIDGQGLGAQEVEVVASGTSLSSFSMGAGSSLRGGMVTLVDMATGEVVGRRGISFQGSGGAGTTTVDPPFVVEDGATYTAYMNTPYVRIELPAMDGGKPFVRKRHDRLFVDVKTSSALTPVVVKAFINRNPYTSRRTIDLYTTKQIEASTDVAWDVDVRLVQPWEKKRLNLFLNGQTCSIVFEQFRPETLMLAHLELTGRAMNDRYFG